jgi:hypothetical protein
MSDEGYPPTPPKRYSDYNHDGDRYWQTPVGTYPISIEIMDRMPLLTSEQQQTWWKTQQTRLASAVTAGTEDDFEVTDDGLP